MAIARINMKRIAKEKRLVFQFFASATLVLLAMLFCDHVKDLFILVATTQFNKAILKYVIPPPNSSDKIDKPNKPNALCFRPTKKVDQLLIKRVSKLRQSLLSKNLVSKSMPSLLRPLKSHGRINCFNLNSVSGDISMHYLKEAMFNTNKIPDCPNS